MTVTGPPEIICSLKSGITEPEELITLPNLTIQRLYHDLLNYLNVPESIILQVF